MSLSQEANPLLEEWQTPYGLPPFDRILPEHFSPAFDAAMLQHKREIEAVATLADAPTFNNCVAAFDACGEWLNRIEMVFYNLASSETSPALQAIERELSPRLAAHSSAVYQNEALFARLHALYEKRNSLGLTTEQLRLLERFHLDFELAGATLAAQDKARFAAIVEELAALSTQFSQNVLADESSFALTLATPDERAGLPPFVLDAALQAASERGLPEGTHVITLSPSLAEPFLTFSERRDLREQVWRARGARGAQAGEHDNRPLAARIVALRQEQAALLGYATYAEYKLADRMAPSVAAVDELLQRAWKPAISKAKHDRERLNALAVELGQPTPIAAWDWRYLSEKVRQKNFAIDDAQVKPYFSLDAMLTAMFDCASRLFGVRFKERHGIPLYHPDARLWEVMDSEGKMIGVFIGDNFARQTKRSGAWMSLLRSQSGRNGGTLPIVLNNNNFAKGSPALLSFDDIRTLFHEFGHGLHGLMSNVQYERLAGTNVLRDFVELPSQLFENWAREREVLLRHARHVETGEPIPAELLERLQAASRFNQAFTTVQYVGPALLDMALHARTDNTPVDIAQFQAEQAARLGVPEDIGMRHYLPHFQHLFSGDSYAAGYYVYMWAEVLEADGYAAFEEAGDPFDRATAERLLKWIYSVGNSIDPATAFRSFRGRDPSVEPMLEKRGLLETSALG
ncbi:M3 family metallopeptidase [Paraburkholderia phenazinium]|jgi:peptidyl-dipeptidase Dcp|uniref:Peptidyl-dipeptidase Dcp Metallo peptidase. MEROPS family M03A n=1 Tax=Paraburkholderia phenazinium TaxID=60549 RepID=A0A1N6LHR3_9BURK|nr:M3 family metallopeptidase [Paraburkholderia phenazinium]SIO68216.1 peptidyl-dipeptidase Dcp Metallo peptidase. MEROPS family M03A [Paraburkholderia phenazinium]